MNKLVDTLVNKLVKTLVNKLVKTLVSISLEQTRENFGEHIGEQTSENFGEHPGGQTSENFVEHIGGQGGEWSGSRWVSDNSKPSDVATVHKFFFSLFEIKQKEYKRCGW